MRIGQSTDIHQLIEGRPLILGGVTIPHDKGSLGHSDGDALLHAIAEAMLGALSLGDLGTHFEDTDPLNKDISSLLILSKVSLLIAKKGYRIINIDSLIIIEKPKLRTHIEEMKQNIIKVLNIKEDQINIKATRGEKLVYIGKEQGLMAQAIVLLQKNEK
ncbi:MAG: 2-C-methyl-D-erythritol 2,4-cyclodiphosphate synthase [Bacilli bacterium]